MMVPPQGEVKFFTSSERAEWHRLKVALWCWENSMPRSILKASATIIKSSQGPECGPWHYLLIIVLELHIWNWNVFKIFIA